MLRSLIAALLVAAASNASAATFDPCIAFAAQMKEIAVARDRGELFSKFLLSKAGSFADDAEQEQYFKAAAAIFLNPNMPADYWETVSLDACNKG